MGPKRQWWEEFFKGAWLDVQSLARTPEQTTKEADFIESVLKIQPPAAILDVPCGNGRLAVELASRGYKMSGIDMTEDFLNKAREKADKRDLDITFHKGDMRQIPWKEEFHAAICIWGSFGYFDEEGDAAFIEAVSSSLKTGGRFLLDIHVAETLFPKYQPKGWSKIGDTFILEDRYFDQATGRVEVDWTFVREAKQETHHTSIRIYTYKEIEDLLRQHGFERFEAFGSLSKDPFKFAATRLLMVAKKG